MRAASASENRTFLWMRYFEIRCYSSAGVCGRLPRARNRSGHPHGAVGAGISVLVPKAAHGWGSRRASRSWEVPAWEGPVVSGHELGGVCGGVRQRARDGAPGVTKHDSVS